MGTCRVPFGPSEQRPEVERGHGAIDISLLRSKEANAALTLTLNSDENIC